MDTRFGRSLGGSSQKLIQMWSCPRCGLSFRHPMPDNASLAAGYRQASATIWREVNHAYWADVREQLARRAPGHRVLDVGCYRADFLASLGQDWQTFAVELNEAAAAEARQRGVDVLADRLANVPLAAGPFDAITMLDLLEHLPDPVSDIRRAVRLLAPRGILLIATGNADTLGWRLQGADYYYVRLPEHVTFYRPRWFEWLTERMPLELIHLRGFRREGWNALPWLWWLLRYLACLPLSFYRRLRLRPDRSPLMWRYRRLVQRPPLQAAPHARDHMLVILRKTVGKSKAIHVAPEIPRQPATERGTT